VIKAIAIGAWGGAMLKRAEIAEKSIYKYIAYDSKGEVVKGKLSASNEEAVGEMLDYAGYRLINVKRVVPFLGASGLSSSFQSKIKPGEIVLLYRQLALLLESGIDIVTSLGLLRSQLSSRTMSRILESVITDLRAGNQFSVALDKHPEAFPPICCQTLRVGEQTGNLEVMLRQVADYIEKSANTAKSVKGALMMPMITALIAIGVIGVLVVVVLPTFGNLYSSLGAELPLMTRLLLGFADVLKAYILHILLSVLIVGGAAFAYVKTPRGRYKLDSLLLRLPLMGRIAHLNELSRCSRSISLLFQAGLPLTEIMPIVIQGSNNKVIAEALTNVKQAMIQGEGLSKPMSENPIFLPMMVQMVKVGEETGNLDASLLAVAQNYETDAEDKTRSLIGHIQPAMTIIIAAVVGLITLSLVSAMYSIYGQAF